jgi:hypothetical protein
MKKPNNFYQRILVILAGLFFFSMNAVAQYSISGVSLSPSSPNTLPTNDKVNISFNYSTPSGNVRIFARPMYNGSLAPNYAAHGSPVYSAPSGAGTGYFTLTTAGNVDQVRFQIYNATTNALLYTTYRSVSYSFINYRISNISLSPASPAILGTNEYVNVTFKYIAKNGNVRIFARPMYNGAPATNYAAHGSPVYSATSGSGSGFFTLTSAGLVDQVRFQIYDATTNALLYTTYKTVSYSFVNYRISNVSLSPVSPALLASNENVNLTFKYIAKNGNVRIFARPMYNGALAPNYAAHGSPVYSASSGSGTGFFTLTSSGLVDQVRFQIYDATSNALLYTTYKSVSYTFDNYRISNVSLSPASPATLDINENVNVTFKYIAKNGNVRIFARPMRNGSLAPNYAAHGSPLYTAPSGSGTGYFTLTSAGNVDQVRFQIYDATSNVLLYTKYVSVNYSFINPARVADSEEQTSETIQFAVGPIPTKDVLNITNENNVEFAYKLFDSNGTLVKEGESASAKELVQLDAFTPGIYILHISSGKDLIKKTIVVE